MKSIYPDCSLNNRSMNITYSEDTDTLVLRLSNQPIFKEALPNWDTHIYYAFDGSVTKIVIGKASAQNIWPPKKL